MADEEREKRLEALRLKYGRVGHVDFAGHFLVFRRPARAEVREYRRKEDVPSEKVDRVDSLANQLLVAFDANEDPVGARGLFLTFLDEYPGFCDSPKIQTVLAVLMGMQEEEHATILGKGCSVRSGPRPTSPPV
jgi:hypothetical protein